MMKTLQLAGNARYGGATYLMLEWSKFLIDHGCEVHALCTDETMKAKAEKIPGLRLLDSIYIPREIAPATDAKAFAQLLRLLHSERYDLIHTYTETPAFLGRIAAWLMRVPVSVNHQGGWPVNPTSSRMQNALYRPLEYLATLASTRNICVSHAEAARGAELRIAPRRKLVTIVNGLDPRPFDPETIRASGAEFRRSLGFGPQHHLIGSTSRLVPGKGNEDVMHGFRILTNEHPDLDAQLLIAGDGTDREDLEALARELGIEDRTHFLGFVRDVPAFLGAIDSFVTGSLTEGLSIALLEAMASAKPIVSTAIAPNYEVLQDTGLTVPVSSPRAIAEALRQLATDPELASECAVSARERLLSHYTLERMFDETWQLYIDLLSQKRHR